MCTIKSSVWVLVQSYPDYLRENRMNLFTKIERRKEESLLESNFWREISEGVANVFSFFNKLEQLHNFFRPNIKN